MRRISRAVWAFVAVGGIATMVACQGQSSPPPPKCTNPVLLSRGAPVAVSANPKDAAAITDGKTNPGNWNALGLPPQWVEIDLGAPSVVHQVKAIPEQTPAGYAEHKITGTLSNGETRVLGDLNGNSQSGVEIVRDISEEAGRGIRKVRIETVKTPRSWVSWREIEIYGCR